MAELHLKSYRFRSEREADWRRLEGLLAKVGKGSAKALSDEELLALPVLYRQALSSLSVARATSLDQGLVDYLESLSTRAYFLVYGTRSGFPAVLGGTYTLQGGVCDLGTAPPYTWVGSPDPAALDPASRLLFILVLADDNGTTEGSWGHASLGLERNGPGTHGASNRCGAVDKDLSNTCGNAP